MEKIKAFEMVVLDEHVLAVAQEGAIGDWSAYIGVVIGRNHEDEAIEVLRRGSKLSKKLAEILFPDFKALNWRY